MYMYIYTLPYDPRLFIWTNVDARMFDEEGILLPFDCAMDAETGLCYPSGEPCEDGDYQWCVSSPVWSMCAWSDVDDGNVAAQCSVTTDVVPLYTIVPTFSDDDGEVDGYDIFTEETGTDAKEKQSSFYGDGMPVVVRGAYEKF